MASANPAATNQIQSMLGNLLGQLSPGGLTYGSNPYTTGYLGYQGFGPSPYSFSYGPYGWGSYGYAPGQTGKGFSSPQIPPLFDTVGRRANSWSLS